MARLGGLRCTHTLWHCVRVRVVEPTRTNSNMNDIMKLISSSASDIRGLFHGVAHLVRSRQVHGHARLHPATAPRNGTTPQPRHAPTRFGRPAIVPPARAAPNALLLFKLSKFMSRRKPR